MTKFEDNLSPYNSFVESAAPSSPSAGNQRLYIDSADHKLKRKNSSGTVTNLEAALGYSGVTWSSGTSMPGSPATNDRVTRTDLALDFYYDGTRWVTTQLYRETFGMGGSLTPFTTGGDSIGRISPWSTTYDLWLDAFWCTTFVLTTNTGSAYWTLDCRKEDSANSATSIVTANTSADAASTWVQRRTAIGAAYVAANYRELEVYASKTGAPGNLYWAAALSYRLIGT